MKKIFFAVFSFIVLTCLFLLNLKVSANDLTGFVSIPATQSIKSFYIGQYPVTNAEYKAFVDSTNSRTPNYWAYGTYPTGKGNACLRSSYCSLQGFIRIRLYFHFGKSFTYKFR